MPSRAPSSKRAKSFAMRSRGTCPLACSWRICLHLKHQKERKLHRATHAGRHAHARRSMGGRFGGSNTGRAVSAVELAKIAFSDLTSVDASSFRRERVLGGEQRRRVGPEQDAPRAP